MPRGGGGWHGESGGGHHGGGGGFLPGLPGLPGPRVSVRIGGGYPVYGGGYPVVYGGGPGGGGYPQGGPSYQGGGGGGGFLENMFKGGNWIMGAIIGAVLGSLLGQPILGAVLGAVAMGIGTDGFSSIMSGAGNMFSRVKGMFNGGASSPSQAQAPQLSLMDQQATPDTGPPSRPPVDILPPPPTPSVGLDPSASRTQ